MRIVPNWISELTVKIFLFFINEETNKEFFNLRVFMNFTTAALVLLN